MSWNTSRCSVLGIICVATACTKSPMASADASVVSVTAVDAGSHEAVDRCAEAMGAHLLREAGSPPSTDAQMAIACAPMFKESACRDAHLHLHDRPDKSSFMVLSSEKAEQRGSERASPLKFPEVLRG
jgi:hypothetical protein